MGLREWFFLVPIVLLLHELEEWNVHEYHKTVFLPGESVETKLSERLWLIFLSLTGFAWITISVFIPNRIVYTIFNLLLADFTLMNGLQHIFISIKTRRYYPGLIFGGLVGTAANLAIIWKIASESIIPLWMLILVVALIIPAMLDSLVQSRKGKLPLLVKSILKFSLKLERVFTT